MLLENPAIVADVVIAAVLVLAVIIGARKGLVKSLAGVVIVAAAFIGASFVANAFAEPVAEFLGPMIEENILEKLALERAFAHRQALDLEGLVLMEEGQVLAMTMGSRLSETTFDIHFEKALDIADGTYAAINQGFAAYLREKYPELLWLNREEDMGLEGLRKAKLSYNPHHMIEKSWALLQEEGYDY